MMVTDRRRWLRVLAPPAAVALAMVVRLQLWPALFEDATYLPLFMAVLFCAWFGGLWPGIVATVLGALAAMWWLIEPTHTLTITNAQHHVQLGLFVIFSTAIVMACASLHGERRRGVSLRGDIRELEAAQTQLRALAAHLSETHRRKDEFLATLAHELRNPLAPMRNSLELLRLADDVPRRDSARRTMERQLAHLVRLVDDLLDVSRITRDKLHLRRETVVLDDVLRDVVESARPLMQAQDHQLELVLPDAPVFLHADPVRITQVVGNLLHNAGKYTPAGGHIRVQARRQEGGVEIEVVDDGIGVAPELQERVFEMFRQGDGSLERAHGGLGIGLGLARRLVELHDGRIELHSEGQGHGTRVTVHLPTLPGPAAPAAAHASLAPRPARANCRVLVADDNVDAADSMAMMLQLLGHQVQVARDGLQAVEAARAFAPHLVLLDIGMPGLNGLEVCRRLRAAPGGEAMRIVAVTGWGHANDRAQSREAGFDEHLVKPMNPAQLRRLLDSLPV